MIKFWRIFYNDYSYHVFSRRFILTTISLPAIFIGIAIIFIFMTMFLMDRKPAGYVDQSGWLNNPLMAKGDPLSLTEIKLLRFDSETSARSALEDKKIQAYFVISPDYLSTGKVHLVSNETPGQPVYSTFRNFIRQNLLASQPQAISERLMRGNSWDIRVTAQNASGTQNQWMKLILPMVGVFIYMMLINISSGYLLQSILEEKENRTIEILVTSVSPYQLMAGKIIGNMSIGFTRIFAWFGIPFLLAVGLLNLSPELKKALYFDPQIILLMVAILIPSFIMVSSIMAAIGAVAVEADQAQMIAGLFTLPIMVSYLLIFSIMGNPDGPLAFGLSIFPLTSPLVLPARAAFTHIPDWQIALSIFLVYLCAAGALWLAGKAFHQSLLQYGKKFSLKRLFYRGQES